jgi:hypothetical protein
MKRWRFKTEKEYKKEYGPNWRGVVRYQWPEPMDDLLGVEIPKERIDEFFKVKLVKYNGWSVSRANITLIKGKGSYTLSFSFRKKSPPPSVNIFKMPWSI